MEKIIEYKNAHKLGQLGQTTVLVGGCFDILHFGHLKFLERAKSYGEKLIVALESDATVRRLKGKNRPIQNQNERAEMLSALRFVDFVLLLDPMNSYKDYEKLVKAITPRVICLTDGDKYITEKTEQAAKTGAKIAIIPKVITHSTSELSKIIGLD